MIYDAGLTAVLFLSCRPPSVADHSQHTQHFLWTDCGPYVVPLPALLSAVLIYLIDYEPNPRIFLCMHQQSCTSAVCARNCVLGDNKDPAAVVV